MAEEYKEERAKFRDASMSAWKGLVQYLAPLGGNVEWRSANMILPVIKLIGKKAGLNLNHTFMPRGGGLDLHDATLAHESGCLMLDFDDSYRIVKPAKLELITFENDPLCEWAYFRLECSDLKPSGVFDERSADYEYEEVLELAPGEYADRGHWDAGYLGYDEDGREVPLPKGARPITRLLQGALVVFAKASAYNNKNDTYDGRHSKMTAEAFRDHIEANLAHMHELGVYGQDSF